MILNVINGDDYMDFMSLYYHLPILAQNIAVSAKGYLQNRQRYGKVYYNSLDEFLKRDYSLQSELIDFQWYKIEEIVRYAYHNSAFYRKLYEGIDLDSVFKNRDITLLPILAKETVRQNLPRMYTVQPNKKGYHKSNTSGTTGTSMQFLFSDEDTQRRLAYLDAFKIKHGYIPFKMKRASFTSAKVIGAHQKKPIYWRDNITIKQRLYSGYFCKGKLVRYYVDNLNKFRPDSLDGYPSAIYEIAKYINNNNIHLNFNPVAIFPTAETLLPHYRKEIEKAFQCPVRDQYASSDGAPFIIECKCGKMHVCIDTGLIEFLDDGRMLMTSFETHGTPLIRYDIGDRAHLSTNQTCNCGISMPVVDRIEGRTTDYIISPEYGKMTSVYLSLVSEDFHNCMKAMQFVQNDLYSIDVYIEVDDNYDKSMNKIIIDKLHYSMGNAVNIRVHPVDEIEKDKSGKFRFIINNL